jgi:hypothetical protein
MTAFDAGTIEMAGAEEAEAPAEVDVGLGE